MTRDSGVRRDGDSEPFVLTPQTPEAVLENVETKMTKEQRLHQVEQFLKNRLEKKTVEYPDEAALGHGYLKGVPSDVATDDFADIVLFCALLTNNSIVNDFEFPDPDSSDMVEDYHVLKEKTIELIKQENQKSDTKWLKKKDFLSDDGRWVHLYIIDDHWGFNVGPDRLIELGVDLEDRQQRRDRVAKLTEQFSGQQAGAVYGGIEERYAFTLFFARLKEIYKGETEEQCMSRARKIIKEMIEAGFRFNDSSGDSKTRKYHELYKMIEEDIILGEKNRSDDEEARVISRFVDKWREIEAKFARFLSDDDEYYN